MGVNIRSMLSMRSVCVTRYESVATSRECITRAYIPRIVVLQNLPLRPLTDILQLRDLVEQLPQLLGYTLLLLRVTLRAIRRCPVIDEELHVVMERPRLADDLCGQFLELALRRLLRAVRGVG